LNVHLGFASLFSRYHALHVLRSLVALSGNYMYFNGLWVIYDVHVTTTITTARNITYVVIGCAMTVVAGSWTYNAFEPCPDDEDLLDDVNNTDDVDDDDAHESDDNAFTKRGDDYDTTTSSDALIAYAGATD
jgi:hypothetical protein